MIKHLIAVAVIVPALVACGKKGTETPDTAASAASAVSETSAAGVPASGASGTHAMPIIEEKAQANGGMYTVAAGDTLGRIAKKSGVSAHDLAQWNNITDPKRLRVGQQLRLSAPGQGVAEKGAPAK